MKKISILVSILFAAPCVYAQDTVENVDLKEVVVVAPTRPENYTPHVSSANTGLEISLRETPQSVTVVTEQQIKDQGLRNVAEVLKQTPGVTGVGQGSGLAANSTLYAPGFEVNNYRIDGLSQVGMNTASARNSMSTAIYESVTVSRGANGLLGAYGHPGATVELTRKRPTAKFKNSIDVGAGSWGGYHATYDVSGALNEAKTLRGRAVANYENVGLWADRAKENDRLFYGIMEYNFTPDTMMTLGMQHNMTQNKDSSRAGFQPYYGNVATGYQFLNVGPTDNPSTDWAYANRRQTQVFTELEHHFNDDWKLKARYNYSRTKAEQLYGAVGNTAVSSDLTSSLDAGFISNNPREHSFSLDMTGQLHLLGRNHPVNIGMTHAHFNDNKNPVKSYSVNPKPSYSLVDYRGNVPNPVASFTDNGTGGQRYKFTSLYFSGQFKATDKLAVLLGGRYSNYYSDTKVSDTNPNLLVTRERGIFTPYLGVTYDIAKWATVYANYSEIFNPLFGNRTGSDGQVLDPEEGKAYEVGAKGEWFGGRLNASASAYEIHKDNLAVFGGRTAGRTIWLSADGTKSRGYELTLGGQITPKWHMNASYTRNKIIDQNGQRIRVDTPVHQFKLFSTYDLNNRWRFGGNINWQSATHTQNSTWVSNTLIEQRPYALVDLNVQYRFNAKTTLGLHANNVFDKRYSTYPGTHNNGEPRNFYVNFNHQF